MARPGLLWIWAQAIGGSILAYVLFTFLLPVDAMITNIGYTLLVQFGVDSRWMSLYNNYIVIIANWIPILCVAMFISTVIWVVTSSGRKVDSLEEF